MCVCVCVCVYVCVCVCVCTCPCERACLYVSDKVRMIAHVAQMVILLVIHLMSSMVTRRTNDGRDP